MNTTEAVKPPPPQSAHAPQSNPHPNAHPPATKPPALDAALDEILPLIGCVAVAGPPVILMAGPWLLFTLMLLGPFLLLVTFTLITAILVALTAAILAPPYLLLHHARRHWTRPPIRHPLVHHLRGRRPTDFSWLPQLPGARVIDRPAAQPLGATRVDNHTQPPLTSEGI